MRQLHAKLSLLFALFGHHGSRCSLRELLHGCRDGPGAFRHGRLRLHLRLRLDRFLRLQSLRQRILTALHKQIEQREHQDGHGAKQQCHEHHALIKML